MYEKTKNTSYCDRVQNDPTMQTARKTISKLKGFSTGNAYDLGSQYVAVKIKLGYYNNLIADNKLDNKNILKRVIEQLRSDFYGSNGKAMKFINEFAAANNLLKEKEIIDNLLNECLAIQAEAKNYSKNTPKYKEVAQRFFAKRAEFRAAIDNFITKYAKDEVKINNYAAMIHNLSDAEFMDRVFTTQRLSPIRKKFNDILNREDLDELFAEDESSINNENNDGHNEFSKTWNEYLYQSAKAYLSPELKFYLDTIIKMNQPLQRDVEDSIEAHYDLDNEVGVPQAYSYMFVFQQLVMMGDMSSVDNFIKSVWEGSFRNPELYGISKVARDMQNNPLLATKIFIAAQHPIIAKTMAIIRDGAVTYEQSNADANALGVTIYNIMNSLKLTYRNAYDPVAFEQLKSYRQDYFIKSRKYSQNTEVYNEAADIISKMINTMVPNIQERVVKTYLFQNTNDAEIVNRFSGMFDIINTIHINHGGIISAVKEYKEVSKEYATKLHAYNEYRQAGIETNSKPEFPKIYGIDFDAPAIKQAIICLAKALVRYDISKVNMQSRNAENNLATNMLNNCYITRINEILNSPNAANQFAKTIASAPQNQYSTIFFGIHQNGVNIPGLFTRQADGTVVPNPKGLNYFGVRLFDGIRDDTSGTGVMYNQMTKADYFRTQLEMFFKPIKDHNRPEIKTGFFEAFMQTPSDAPKNFAIQQQRLDCKRLFEIDATNLDVEISNASIDLEEKLDEASKLAENINKPLIVDNIEKRVKTIIDKINRNQKNELDFIDLDFTDYDFITIGELYDYIYDNHKVFTIDRRFTTRDGKDIIDNGRLDNKKRSVIAPIITPVNGGYIISFISGVRYKGSNRIYTNSPVEIIRVDDDGRIIDRTNDNSIDAETGKPTPNRAIAEFIVDDPTIREKMIDVGIRSRTLKYNINPKTINKNQLFLAFKQQLYGELNTFVTQLGNVFERKVTKKNGVPQVKYVLRKDTKNLSDRLHFDKNGKLFDNGRLTGNFFKFNRLFETANVNVDARMIDMLSLYGQDKVIKRNGKEIIFDADAAAQLCPYIELNDADGTLNFKLAPDAELDAQITELVGEWLLDYRDEIIGNVRQYDSVINGKYSYDQVLDCMLNGTIAEYNFADLFAGDVKIYNTAQDYLKRFKEVQAGGSVYALYDLNRGLGGNIQELDVDANGKPVPVKINGRTIYVGSKEKGTYRPLTRRTGFRAVTIKNSTSAVEAAPRIESEIREYKERKFKEQGYTEAEAKSRAEAIAKEVAKGYFEKTKKNDAQSYITFEEFIMRRVADGTVDQYYDIIDQIMQIREGKMAVEDLDVSKINARIQVQKNFYFDQYMYPDNNVLTSRQVKNAEFVLIPELLEGTELHDLWEIMNEYDIQQINTEETTKAGKRNVLEYWDNDNVAHADEFRKQLDDTPLAAEPFFYAYLYKQLDVPNHIGDSKNKAGIQLLKKIIDNCTPATRPFVENYMKSFTANIKHSFNKMLYNCGWTINDEGFVVDRETGGEVNFDTFYAKARHQAETLGLDSNFMDYFQPNEDGVQMPNWMNDTSSKLESIFNSIFNSAVTRQTLPGWHAAQVTGIGHGVKVKDESGKFRKLEYHPEIKDENGNVTHQAYAEVLVPRWSKLLPKDITPEQLQDIETGKGLDMMIGYRIPTEGKQSISVFKVVGFLDEVYGATVMVPDEWVTQTGSGFEIDSIYAITYEIELDEQGRLRKIPFDRDVTDAGYRRRYIKYVKDMLSSQLKDGYYNKTTKRIAITKAKMLEYKRDPNAKTPKETLVEIFDKIKTIENKNVQKVIGKIVRKAVIDNREQSGTKEDGTTTYRVFWQSAFIETNNLLNRYLESSKELDNNSKKLIAELIEQVREGAFNANKVATNNCQLDLWYERQQALKDDLFEHVKKVAIENGLVSYDEFQTWDILDQQSPAARNNYILDNMIDIMQHEDSREENFSRSNFDDLTNAKNIVDEVREKSNKGTKPRSKYSAYNPMDQINYFEDAMSGAKLKAFSINYDTFSSVCNYMRAQLSEEDAIVVRYEKKPYGKFEYDIRDMQEMAIGKDVEVSEDKKYIQITHRGFGWSGNNRNVVGKILTAYSSQTTAHIFDAIKNGIIYNENDYTFKVFKTLVCTGIDYYTAILLLAQPAVDTIIKAYYTLSIYADNTANPINIAIKRTLQSIAGCEEINKYSSMDEVFDTIQTNKRIMTLLKKYSTNGSNDIREMNFIIDQKVMRKRLSGGLNEIQKQISDLVTLLAFRKIHQTAIKIEALQRVSNPDKFGAKQTLRETNEVVDNMNRYRENSGDENGENIGSTLIVDGKYFVDALYPVKEDEVGIDVEKSNYNFLAAAMQYATIPSLQLGLKLFIVNKDLLNHGEGHVAVHEENTFGRSLTNEQFKKYKQYYISLAYSQAKALNFPIELSEEGKIQLKGEPIEAARAAEIDRVYGRRFDERVPFTCADLLNPTKEEIAEFSKLTPCEKVLFIQKAFSDANPAIAEHKTMLCEKLSTDVYIARTKNKIPLWNVLPTGDIYIANNKYKDNTIHEILRYHEDIYSIEDALVDFRAMFTSKNPLIRLTAIDLVKYAFIVEGGNFKKNGIKKIITNDALYKRFDQYGTNMLDDIDINMVSEDILQEKFVRANPDVVREVSVLGMNFSGKPWDWGNIESIFRINTHLALYIPITNETKGLINLLQNKNKCISVYIRIKQKLTRNTIDTTLPLRTIHKKWIISILYKVIPVKYGYFFIPMPSEGIEHISLASKNNLIRPDSQTTIPLLSLEHYTELIGRLKISEDTTASDIAKITKEASTIKLKDFVPHEEGMQP